MQFDTKIAVVIRTDLEPWQKLNVASFLAGGIAAAFPECIGEPYPAFLTLLGASGSRISESSFARSTFR
jgi:hypothetical protein